MSSTNRGVVREKDDLYETPGWVTELLLKEEIFVGEILEPAVGRGKIKKVLENKGLKVTGLDINPEFKPDITLDFRNYSKEASNIITNPPFIFALEYVKKCLEIVKKGGKVALLLRLNFLESKKRYVFFKENMPKKLIVLSERPKFLNNKTDSICYSWFVWEKGWSGETVLKLVSKTDLSRLSGFF